MSPTAARKVAAAIRLTPGTVISRLTSAESSAAGDQRLDRGDLLARGSRSGAGSRRPSRASSRQLELAQPAAAALAEQVATGGRATSGGASARRGPRSWRACAPGPAGSRRASRRRSARVCSSGIQTAVQRARGEQPRQRAGVEPVGLRPRLPDPRVGRVDDHHPADVRLDDPRDLPRVAGHLERDLVVEPRLCANSSSAAGVVSIRPAERTSPVLDDRDLAEVAVDVEPITLSPLLPSFVVGRRTGGQTTPTDSCSQHNRASRRGGHRKVGLEAHRAANGLPSLRSRSGPVGARPTRARPRIPPRFRCCR